MEQVKKIFTQLQSTNSKLNKQKIIWRNKNNELFKDTLIFLFSPYILTGINKKKINKELSTRKNNTHSNKYSWLDIKNYLIEHKSGTDKDIVIIQDFINGQTLEMKEFYSSLITKSIKLGCDAKIINSVIPNLIPTFDVMLGTPKEKCKIRQGEWFSISQKLNGNRCVYFDGKLLSRQGKEFTGLEHILKDIHKLIGDSNYVLDGELVGKNIEGLSDSENFQKSTGLANSKKSKKTSLKLIVFDILPNEEFKRGYSNDTYKKRKCNLISLKERIHSLKLENVGVVDMFYEGTNQSEIDKWLEYAEQNDIEGVMLNLDTPYECKRVKTLQKVKAFKDIDLRCISVNKADTGKYKGTLGSITCKYKNGTVDVGSGFSDEQRGYYFNNKDEIIGKIVTVKYKEATVNKNGGESLQFPVFIDVRFDKGIADDEI